MLKNLRISIKKTYVCKTLLFFQLAMLEYEFEANERGIILKLEGLNDKLARLLETILSSFSRFESRLTDNLFRVVREQVSVLDLAFLLFLFKIFHDIK